MSDAFKINVVGFRELQAKLKQAAPNLTRLISAELKDGANAIAAEAKSRAPADQGILRNEISVQQIDNLHFAVVSGALYSAFVEFGTRSQVDVPAELQDYASQFQGQGGSTGAKQMIFDWCQRKGIDPKFWYPIYISVMVKGVKPQPFFFPAVNRLTPVIITNVERALND